MLEQIKSVECPLLEPLDNTLIPWPGMKFSCVRLLELYGKIFNQVELCQLIVRKTCSSCKCPREGHDVYHEEWVNVKERLGLADIEKTGATIKDKNYGQGFAWTPANLPNYKIEQYFKCLPNDKIPKLGTDGEKYRERQLMLQLPKQDMALAYCRHLDAEYQTNYEDFINARNEIALDIAYVKDCTSRAECPECRKWLMPSEVGVVSTKFGERWMWHPSCFVCSQCKEILVDLSYCVHNDKVYCERHYAEQMKPRCAACDEETRICNLAMQV